MMPKVQQLTKIIRSSVEKKLADREKRCLNQGIN